MRHNQRVKPEAPDPEVKSDGAMAARQWPQTDAEWANAKLVGWPTRFPYNIDVSTQRPYPQSQAVDAVLFVYQYFRLPFTYLFDRPFKTVLYTSGLKYNPTYTAMPALPLSRIPEANPPGYQGQAGNGQSNNGPQQDTGEQRDNFYTSPAKPGGFGTPSLAPIPAPGNPAQGTPGVQAPGTPGERGMPGAGTPGVQSPGGTGAGGAGGAGGGK